MFIDYAYEDLRATVAAATGMTPVRAPYNGPITYPWCAMQLVAGPASQVDQVRRSQRESVAVTVGDLAMGDEVSCLIAGRHLTLEFGLNATVTATALAALAPSHWTATAVGATVTFTGPDIFGGFAISGCTVVRSQVGEWLEVEVVRRMATWQVSFWHTNPRRELAAPNGVDSCSLAVRDAIRRRARVSTLERAYMTAREPVPSTWQGTDGKSYVGSVVRVELVWTDLVTSGEPIDIVAVDDVVISYP